MVKVRPVQNGRTTRMSFSRINEVINMPNLIEIQKNSYNWFLEEGLREVFHDIAAIEDYTGNLVLEFIDYRLDKHPKYTIKECKERDATYAAPLYVTARLFNKQTGEVKEQEIFMGDFPLMTDSGTFISNGAERVIVSQLVRSPGVYYASTKDRTGKDLFTATMNPNRGAWLEYETDSSDVYYVRIDKNRKLPVTVLLRALGLGTDEQIRQFFGDSEPKINATLEKDTTHSTEEGLLEVYRKLRPGEPPTVESSRSHLDALFFDPRRYDLARFGRYKMNNKLALARRITGLRAGEDVIAPLTGELLIANGEKIDRAKAEEIDAAGVTRIKVLIDQKMGDPVPFIVISNGCVDAQPFFGFDVEKEAGINERASLAGIREILHHRRDRPPGQPPRAQRGRAAAEPVPHRLLPHGACHPRAHDPAEPGVRRDHPPEPGQHPPRRGGHQGVHRLQPAVPVHGPEQPPGRADPQAPPVRSGPRRPVP